MMTYAAIIKPLVTRPDSAHSMTRTGPRDGDFGGRGSLTPSPRRLQLGCTQRMDSDTPGRQLIYDLLQEADYAVSGRACLAPKRHIPTKARRVRRRIGAPHITHEMVWPPPFVRG